MSFNLLKGKRGIIFGALNDASIAWKVAERAVEEGAQIVLTNTAVACRMGTIDELAKKTNATIIPADATSVEDLTNLFEKAQEALGGKIDFVLHSCAMSVNMRKKRTYDDLDYSFLNKTLDLLKFLIPHYVSEGKHRLVIAVGCTGGAHRSVAIAEAIAEFLCQKKYQVDVNHRDLDLEQAHWKNG